MDTVQQTVLVTATRDAVSRAVRQALQAILPTLLVVAGGSVTGIDVAAVVILAAITAAVSMLKSVLNVKVPADAPIGYQLAERAITAAAGAALGLITVDGTTPAADIPWTATLTAALGAAAVAVAMYFTNPPVVEGETIPGELVDEEVPSRDLAEGQQFLAGEPLPKRRRAASPETTSLPLNESGEDR